MLKWYWAKDGVKFMKGRGGGTRAGSWSREQGHFAYDDIMFYDRGEIMLIELSNVEMMLISSWDVQMMPNWWLDKFET